MAMMSHTILIIEDDQPTRELYERELSATYHVLARSDDCEVLDEIKAHHVAALVLEPALLGGRGWELLKQLRSTPETHTLPIILCSTQNARRTAESLGATMYMVKPVMPFELLEAIQHVLQLA